MTVTRSSLVPVGTAPSSVRDLWAPPQLLRADWSQAVAISTAYRTRVAQAESLAEVRRGMIDRPGRVVEATMLALGRRDLGALRSTLIRASRARSLVPLYSDRSRTTAAASTGAGSIACPTSYRRFHASGWVAIVDASGDSGTHESVQVTWIDSLTATTITLGEVLAQDFPAGSLVFPLIEAQAVFDHGVDLVTDTVAQVGLTFEETVGASALPSLLADGGIPAGWPTHTDGLPILVGNHNWSQGPRHRLIQPGTDEPIGLGIFQEIIGAQPIRVGEGRVARFLRRSDAWEFLEFFAGRRGRLHPFWFISDDHIHEVVAFDSATTLRITAVGDVEDWSFRPDLGFVMQDGSVQIGEVASVVRAAGEDNILLSNSLSPVPSVSDLRRTTVAFMARFDADEITERWASDEVVDIEHAVTQLIEEKSVTISDLSSQWNEDRTGTRTEDPEACCDPEIPSIPTLDWRHGFDASVLSGYAVDEEVLAAADQSGAGNNLAQTAGNGPTYQEDGPNGEPYLNFENRTKFLNNGSPSIAENGTRTLAVVVRRAVEGRIFIYGVIGNHGCIHWSTIASAIGMNHGKQWWGSYWNFNVCDSDDGHPTVVTDVAYEIAAGEWAILAMRLDNAATPCCELWKNNVLAHTDNTQINQFTGNLAIGGWSNEFSREHDVAWAGLWERWLTDDELDDVFRHLNDRYAIY